MHKPSASILATFVIAVLFSAFAQTAAAAIPQIERDALIDLYNYTNGPGWTNRTNWNGVAGTECTWYGVTCDAGQTTVMFIILQGNQLSGSIPAALGNLSNLHDLSLGSNQLSGSIPAELGNLSNLESLWLGYNQLSGSIPAELGNLSSLRVLWLQRNYLSGSIPASLGNLSSLQDLRLQINQLSGSIPAELGDLSSLRYLYLSGNQLSGSIPAELGNLSSLQYLWLFSNDLNGSIPAELGNLSSLLHLLLSENQLSGSIPAELGNLSSLQILSLGSNQLSGSIPAELGNLSSLVDLYLSGNQLSGSIPTELGSLSSLRALLLESNQLSGSIPAELGNLSSLQYLYLYGNQLSGSIPAELGNLSSLQQLHLYGNQLSGELASSLANLTAVTSLKLSYNALIAVDPGVTAWANARQTAWASTQTVAPASVAVPSLTGTTATLIWTPITYTGQTGRYEVWADAGGGAAFAGSTSNKSATGLTVTGLSGGATYTFSVRTVTYPHGSNANTVTSDFSAGVIAATWSGTPSISIDDVTVTEKNAGTVNANFTVTLSEPSAETVTVQYATANGTASAGADYIAVSLKTLTFVPGDTSETATVLVLGDQVDEANETFYVNLSNPSSAPIADAQGTGTITDDDSARVSVGDAFVDEGDSGTTSATVNVLLTNASASTVTVQWATADGTAAAGVDYSPGGPSTVTFAPGETAKPITVQAIGDTEVEGNEIFFVNLSAPANATIADGQGEVTIVDDDAAAPAVPDPAIVVEGCARAGAACMLSARSLSNGSTASWTYQWKLDGVVKSTGAIWRPSFTVPGTYVASLRATNSAGSGEATTTLVVEPATSCPSDALCTLGGRFQLTLAARDHRTGNTGPGLPLQRNDLFGYFALPALTSNPENPEVFVKMLDGRGVNGNFWVFYGGLTDLEYTLTVKDTVAGTTKTYFKPGGSSQGGFDIGSGVTAETCPNGVAGAVQSPATPSTCQAGSDRLCLNASRFRVELTARDQRTGNTGPGLSIPHNDLFGYFALPALTSNSENPEVFVKVLDGRAVNGFFWVFYGGLTDLEYTMTVTDTITGERKSYTKAPGSACGAFDVSAF